MGMGIFCYFHVCHNTFVLLIAYRRTGLAPTAQWTCSYSVSVHCHHQGLMSNSCSADSGSCSKVMSTLCAAADPATPTRTWVAIERPPVS